MTNSSTTNPDSRIPASLQAVFLASNAGHVVNTPPPRKVASKTFVSSKKQSTGSKRTRTRLSNHLVAKTPQAFLDNALKARGYSTNCFTTTNSGYRNALTPLQLASYDVHILKMVIVDKNPDALTKMLNCGISPNASNKLGESLLHRVCNFGQDKLLQVFLDSGADIQVSDYNGRTPMHEVCRRSIPSFKTFELLLQQDARMIYMQDAEGVAPLSFIRVEHYGAWIAFLESILDTYWKPRHPSSRSQGPPPLALEKFNSRAVPDPENALSLELAALVSGGKMSPDEAIAAQNAEKDKYDDDTTWNESDCSDDEANDDLDFGDEEFAELQKLMDFKLEKEIHLARYFL